MKKLSYLLVGSLMAAQLGFAQKTPGNDVSTPLHALKVDYPVPYEAMPKQEIRKVLDRVYNYLNEVTPARMIHEKTGAVVTDPAQADTNTIIQPGDFRLDSYEWGVTYSGMLLATETTGDQKYSNYVKERFRFMAEWIPVIKKLKTSGAYGQKRFPFRQPIEPHALDDAGAVGASMIKAMRIGINDNLRPQINVYIDWVFNKEYRLKDGTLARNRPQKNTLWLDDLYMGIPIIAQMGKLTGEKKYFDDAIRQVQLYSKRMFLEKEGVYMHGWVESMDPHPAFKWARANGWALLAMCELLDVLPADYPGRDEVLKQFRAHAKGLASYQSASGFWHQLLDRNDSYLETSATAIYAYCIARACNRRWLDPVAYAPMAMLAWNAVATKVNAKGQVEGTCVGTGMAFDPAFYYHRPVNVFAAHGYGPVLLAAAEMYRMMENDPFKINDSSLQFYKE
jgi:unsaturated rhamnogalacturonyl hydrolase